MSNHTPTPWRFRRQVADAEFICRAVNSHDDLLAACETTLELIGNWPTPDGTLSDSWMQMSLVTVEKITNVLNAAIGKAKGTQ